MKPAVVFLHSLGGSPQHWKAQLEHIRDRKTLAPPLPGHPNGPSVTDFDVESMSRALKIDLQDSFVVVGHSGGALIGAAFAAANPKRVASLVLVDAGPDMSGTPPEAIETYLQPFQQDYRKAADAHWSMILNDAHSGVRKKVLDDLHATPAETVMGFLSSMSDFPLVAALAKYPGPIHTIITPISDGPAALHARLPRIKVTLIEGTSHWPHMDKPAEFNRALGL